MKIVCDNCATKYSIADEKVVGKVFKIRCKKCSHIIVVKGTPGEAAAAQAVADGVAAGQDPGTIAQEQPAAVWHLVIDREQVGPMTVEEVREKFRGGQIDNETYAWREGFDDWLKLAQIDEFRDLSAPPQNNTDDQATRRSNSADLFNQASREEEPAPSADLFNSAAPVSEHVRTSAPNAATIMASTHTDEYAPPASSGRSRPSPDDAALSAGADIRPMTGARSENSVLFSLNNLQALATGGGPSSQPKPGYANSQSEGSGLIDIRQMAAQTLSANSFSMGNANKPDELPLPNDAPMFSAVAPSVLLPSAEPQGMPKWVWGVVGLGGAMLVGMIILLVSVLKTPTQAPQIPTQGTTLPVVDPVAQNAHPGTPPEKGALPGPTENPGVGKTSPKEPNNPTPAVDPGEKKHHTRGDRDKGPKANSTKDKEPGTPPVQPKVEAQVETPKKPKVVKPKDDLETLLDSASPGGGGKPKAEAAKKDAPEQLSMDMIKSGLKGVSSAVQGCKTPGTYIVKLTIGKNGKISDASVPGKSGDPAADCVAKAVRSARFSEFTGDPQTLSYPFILR